MAGAGNLIEDVIESFGIAHPAGRVGTVEKTSKSVALLCICERAGFCTGGVYLTDGRLAAGIGARRPGFGPASDWIGA